MLRLQGNIEIKFGNLWINHVSWKEDVKEFRDKNKNTLTNFPGIGNNDLSDQECIKQVLYSCCELTIVNNKPDNIVLEGQFFRFPYCIDEEEKFSSFGIRLYPLKGEISSVIIRGACNEEVVVVDSQSPIGFRNNIISMEIFVQRPNPLSYQPVRRPVGFKYHKYTSAWTGNRIED